MPVGQSFSRGEVLAGDPVAVAVQAVGVLAGAALRLEVRLRLLLGGEVGAVLVAAAAGPPPPLDPPLDPPPLDPPPLDPPPRTALSLGRPPP